MQASAQGATKSYSTPTAPKAPVVPDANQLAQELEAYDSCVLLPVVFLSLLLSFAPLARSFWTGLVPEDFPGGSAGGRACKQAGLFQRDSHGFQVGESSVLNRESWQETETGFSRAKQGAETGRDATTLSTRNATDSRTPFVTLSHPLRLFSVSPWPHPRPISPLPVVAPPLLLIPTSQTRHDNTTEQCRPR